MRTFIREVELARMGYFVGSLLSSGIPIARVLQSLEQSTVLVRYRRLYARIRKGVENGLSFQEVFAQEKKAHVAIPVPVQSMIFAGEQTGNLDKVLVHIGENFEAKNDVTAKNLSTLLEPILLIIVWVGVVLLALAVIMPIYGLVGGLGSEPAGSAPQADPDPNTQIEEVGENSLEQKALDVEDVVIDEVVLKEVRILGEYVNVRQGDSLNAEVVGRVYEDGIFDVYEIREEWYFIALGDENRGWIFADLAEDVDGSDDNEAQ